MITLPCTTESLLKTDFFCYMQSSNLPFVKVSGSTIDSRRALMGRDCPSALFYYSAEFVYMCVIQNAPAVHIISTYKLIELTKLLGVLGQSRISQNINQLAKAANSGSLPVNHEVIEELNDACRAIRFVRETLIKAIGIPIKWRAPPVEAGYSEY